MSHLSAYLTAILVFLAVDAAWISAVMKPIFERNLGDMLLDSPRLSVAAGFYAFYILGVLYFCVWPAVNAEALRLAAMNGAILGFIAYGTYEATNMATLKNWTYGMMVLDVAWGMFLTALASVAGYGAYRALG